MNTASTLDSYTTLQDKIRIKLNEYGSKYVPLTVSDLASQLRVKNYNIYQTLYRLKNLGEIELDKKEMPSGRSKIIGVNIIKLEPSGRTYHRAAEKAKSDLVTHRDTEEIEIQMSALKDYLNQKLAILEMQKTAKHAGLNPEDTIKFEANPVAEEGLLLLKLVGDMATELKEVKQNLQMANFDLEAEKRNVEYLSRQIKEDTRKELIASSRN